MSVDYEPTVTTSHTSSIAKQQDTVTNQGEADECPVSSSGVTEKDAIGKYICHCIATKFEDVTLLIMYTI